MIDLILHHYDFSNYSEKVRLALGYKGLSWRSVAIPSVAPKPDLIPLTGGYRRTPVLQIGSDVYCDTRLILRELERRQPLPTLYPPASRLQAHTITYWAENELFRPISLYVSGNNPDAFPDSLQADRAAMRGMPPPDRQTMQRAARRCAPLVRTQVQMIEHMLSDGRRWIIEPATSVADFAVYHALWFMSDRTGSDQLSAYPSIAAWKARMRAFGHGQCVKSTAAEALKVAAGAQPVPLRASAPFPEDPPLGSAVRIRADDYGRDPVEGELVLIDLEEIAVRRRDPNLGEIVVHFPRLGYDLRPI